MEIIRNRFGYYEVKDKPDKDELKEYYSKKYYQQDKGSYSKEYSDEEIKYIRNTIQQKHALIYDLISDNEKPSLLDIGCGEGHTLKYFCDEGWTVIGLDYSEYGIKNHNPECLESFKPGDIYENVDELISNNVYFDIIWLDNVLEHVIDPLDLLIKCESLAKSNSLLIIEVPNDFSTIQNELKQQELIEKDYWIALPDHLSYFNLEGLQNLASEANWSHYDTISDFPIEFNLFNPNANYVNDRKLGRGAHLQRIKLFNLLREISPEKSLDFHRILAEMGIGRQLISVYTKD